MPRAPGLPGRGPKIKHNGDHQSENRRRNRGDTQARGRERPVRLSAQRPARSRGRRRHSHHHRAPGKDRPAHGGCGLADDAGPADGRLLHAARPGRRECLRRRRPGLRGFRPGPGSAGRLSAAPGPRSLQLQFDAADGRRVQTRGARHRRRRGPQHFPARVHAAAQRPPAAGRRGDSLRRVRG